MRDIGNYENNVKAVERQGQDLIKANKASQAFIRRTDDQLKNLRENYAALKTSALQTEVKLDYHELIIIIFNLE